MAKLTVGGGGPPAGTYVATFERTEDYLHQIYGPGLRWIFAICEGPCKGLTATWITGTSPTPKNACGDLLTGLLGRALREGEQVDVQQLVGQRYVIVVMALS